MATLSITISADRAARMQLAVYSNRPDLFPLAAPVILNRATNAVLLASDGTGDNFKTLTDAQLQALINNGKPSDDAALQTVTNQFWTERMRTAAQTRRNYQDSIIVEVMHDPTP